MTNMAECREVIDRGIRSLCLREEIVPSNGGGSFTRSGLLTEAIIKTIREEAAVVGFVDLQNPTAKFMNLATGSAVSVMPDGVVKQIRARGRKAEEKPIRANQQKPVLLSGMLYLGTMFDGGFYKVIDESDPRRYTVVTRGALQGAKAHPTGQSRRVEASPDKPFALYKREPKRHDEKFVEEIRWMMAEAEARAKAGTLLNTTQLSGDQIIMLVVPPASRPFDLRFEKGPDKAGASRWIDQRLVEAITNGMWNVPNFEGIQAPERGRVKKVHGLNVLLIDDFGVDHTLSVDPAQLGEHLRRLTGVAGAPPVQVIVEEGQRVSKGESLFGPFGPGPVEASELTSMVSELVGGGSQLYRGLRQLRAWTLMTQTRDVNGRTALPIEGVTPTKLDQCYMQLISDTGEDLRVQRIILNQGPRGPLRVPEDDSSIGFRADLYSTSQNAEMRRSIKASKNRK